MSRENILDTWLLEVLQTDNIKRVALAGDASLRRYYRIWVDNQSYILMDAPPPESVERFLEVATVLEANHLHVPKIIHRSLELGFLLLSDLGDRLYLNELTDATADELYEDALKALLKLQHVPVPKTRPFEPAFLERQMDIFHDWYLKRHLQLSFAERGYAKRLASIYDGIFKTLAEQPVVLVHRDYHSRNLMVCPGNNPGILDFQDAMFGPLTYDLVSLFQDCYITWPRMKVEKWVLGFKEQQIAIGMLDKRVTDEEFLRWFDITGLQRHLKNLGIFARLYYRDGKNGYLKDIPRVLNYIQETMVRYQELYPLKIFFAEIASETPLCVL
jgi:aminoglycoside/choline kinase family phosphotransferase